jgi:hypothetical protein
LHPRYEGEVLTRCQKQRWPGARIKHRVGDNWLKMYDKFGPLLRVETVINCPQDFWVSHTVRGPAGPSVRWKRLCKSVLGFPRYLEVARAANLRYFDALAAVDATSGGYAQVRQLTESRQHAGRRYAGFNVARKEDVQLFAAVLAGEHQLHGFRAEHIRGQLHGACTDPTQRRRQSGGRATPQTIARPRPDRQNPPHAPLARHRSSPTPPRHHRPPLPPRTPQCRLNSHPKTCAHRARMLNSKNLPVVPIACPSRTGLLLLTKTALRLA